MSIQWTFIAGFLYFELFIVILMIMPLFSPRRWYQFFNSRLFYIVKEHTAMYFYGLLGILCLFLFDAIREMRKYSHSSDPTHLHLASEMKGNVKLFRAQRNFYITGFAIFLSFVIRRLISMLIIQHQLTMKAAQIMKNAEDTVKLAKETVNKSKSSNIDVNEDLKHDLEVTKSVLAEEKLRVKELEVEATNWRIKYEQVIATMNGSGDDNDSI